MVTLLTFMNQIIYVSGRKDLIVSVQYSDQFVLSCIDYFQALIKELFPFCDRCYFHISTINPLRFLRFQKQVVKLLKHFTNETLILGDHSWLVLAFNPSFLYRFTSSGQIVGKLPDCLILMPQCFSRGMPGIPGIFLSVSFWLQPSCKSVLHAMWTMVFNSLDVLNICYLLHLHGISQLPSSAADCYPSSSFLLAL